MSSTIKLFLALLRDYIDQVSSKDTIQNYVTEVSEPIEWGALFKLATYNNVLPFVYDRINKFSTEFDIDNRYILYMKNWIIRNSSKQIRMHDRLNEIVDIFELKQIDYHILKGTILADLYPNPEYRYSCDIDIHIYESQLDEAMNAFENIGYTYNPEYNSESDYKFYTPENYMIELHVELFSKFYEKHKNIFGNINLKSPKYAVFQKISGRSIRTLAPNGFLIYLICHITKHFIGSGINIRYLMDLSIYINKYMDELDFKYIFDILKQLEIDTCVMSFLYICRDYLGMDEMPFTIPKFDETVIDILLYDIVEKHLYFDPTDSLSKYSYDKMYGRLLYYRNNKKIALKMIFPSAQAINKQFSYVKKHKFLLPIAWIHRLCKHFFNILRGKSAKGNITKVQESINRSHLLKELELLK